MAKLSDKNKSLTFIPSPQSPDSAGFITEAADDTVPAGWLECNGQSVLVADYPDLFAEIGYTYGGSGANFNLPGGSLLTNANVTGDLTVDTSTLVVDSTNNRVGIGTASPSSPGTLIGDTGLLHVGNSAVGASGVVLEENDSIWQVSANVDFRVHDNTTQRFTIEKDTGNVGIGTSSPGAALDIDSGDLRVGNSSVNGNLTTNVVNGATANFPCPSGNASICGIVNVLVVLASNAAVRTVKTYFYSNRLGNSPALTELGSDNGGTGSRTFSVSAQADNSITVTNSSGGTCVVSVGFFVTGGG